MMASMPRATARYDLISDFYLSVVGTEVGGETTGVTLLDLLGGVRGTRVLDLACGHGRIARELARCGARVVGVDISDVLLNMARAAEIESPPLRRSPARPSTVSPAIMVWPTSMISMVRSPLLLA